MIQMLEGKFFTVSQSAKIAGCTVSYVRQLLRKGIISGEKIGDRAWIISAKEVEKLKEPPTGKTGRPRKNKNS